MKSNRNSREALWPSEARIDIDEHASPLKMLLYVREVWSIAPDAVLPHLDPPPPVGQSAIPSTPSSDAWGARWQYEWARTWEWYERPAPTDLKGDEDPPPVWTDTYDSGFDKAAYEQWDRMTLEPFLHPHESDDRDALISAWRAGLRSVVVLPFRGKYAEVRKERVLVVSSETRRDPASFQAALRTVA